MSSEPVPIAHISEVDNIEEDLPSQETPEVEEEIKPKVQAKSSVVPVDDLVSALKSFGGSSSKAGNIGRIWEPEPFLVKDLTKLKAFLFQCHLYFWGSSDFKDGSRQVTFALSYLRDVAQEWFEPGISGLTDDYPEWLDNWDLFVDELQTNFGPFDESANIKHKLTNLQMKDSQRISEYLVRFNSLAVCCLWGESTLWYRFYEGLPARLKDEICRGDRKPNMLFELRKKAQNIDAQHWECVQERSQEQNPHLPNQQKTQSSSSNNSSNNTSKPTQPNSSNNSQPSGSKSGKLKETLKPQSTKPDLTRKLDSKGKLTQQE